MVWPAWTGLRLAHPAHSRPKPDNLIRYRHGLHAKNPTARLRRVASTDDPRPAYPQGNPRQPCFMRPALRLRERRYPANPIPAKPNSIITQVEGSGAWLTPNENPIRSTSKLFGRAAKGKITWSGES